MDVNLSERPKHGQRQFNLESFGCEITLDVSRHDFYDNLGDEIMYWERICVFMLNKFGWLMKSLHFKTSEYNYIHDYDLSNVNVMKNWQFVNNNKSNNHNYNYKTPSFLPSNLQELCITDYKHDAYKHLIKNILIKENKIGNYSWLESSKSQFKQVLSLLSDNDCKNLIIESINNQRLNQIILNRMDTKIFDYINQSQDIKSFTTFVNDLADGITSSYNNSGNKPFVLKTALTSNVLTRPISYQIERAGEDVETVKQSNTMSQFITNCFIFMSKMIEKIDQMLFIIEIDFSLIQVSKDVAAVVDVIESTFDCQAKLNKSKFTSIIDLHFDNLKVMRLQHSNTFRMMFKNNGEFDNCNLCKRLYCCPNCDSDLQY